MKCNENHLKEFRRYGADRKVLGGNDRLTDEGHSYNPFSASRGGIKNTQNENNASTHPRVCLYTTV